MPRDGSPLSALNEEIKSLRKRKPVFTDLVPELEQLRSKLPPDLLMDDSPFDLSDEEIEDLYGEITEVLTGRMLKQEGSDEN